MKLIHLLIMLMIFVRVCSAQVPAAPVSVPLSIELGIGGGVSLPGDELSKYTETQGWHAGIKARVHSALPLDVVGSLTYNRIRDKGGSFGPTQSPPDIFGIPTEPGEYVVMWMFGAGLEYKLPVPIVTPYLGADGMLNSISNTKSGSTSFTRGGVGLGGGVQFSVPVFGSFDASVKYQIFNVTGKENGEESLSQVAANLMVIFSVL
ncbi:MAG: outer membrane beta-barrel protein [Ignavibacteriae bacterium]|nr:outer membrane beta-barrel protein [Ignavibacteria bacterium]MBI3365913.1 outer membrane beta-barrel protein [Ignavibacteriota bacterium]